MSTKKKKRSHRRKERRKSKTSLKMKRVPRCIVKWAIPQEIPSWNPSNKIDDSKEPNFYSYNHEIVRLLAAIVSTLEITVNCNG